MNDETRANFAAWVESADIPNFAAPWFRAFGAPPYVVPITIERVEPFATEYDTLHRGHPERYAEYGPPDSEWYTPTPKLLDLEARLDALYAKAFRGVPNPDYDPERAAAWHEKQRARLSQFDIEVGQSYTPDP